MSVIRKTNLMYLSEKKTKQNNTYFFLNFFYIYHLYRMYIVNSITQRLSSQAYHLTGRTDNKRISIVEPTLTLFSISVAVDIKTTTMIIMCK